MQHAARIVSFVLLSMLSWSIPAMAQIGLVEAQLELVDGSLSFAEGERPQMVMGEITNSGEQPAMGIRARIIGFDAAGDIIHVGDGTVSFTTWCGTEGSALHTGCLLPGGTAYISELLPQILDELTDVEVILSGAESSLTELAVAVEPVAPLVPRELPLGIALDGELVNHGSTDLIAVTATAVLRDAEGQLVDISSRAIDGDRIGGYADGIRSGQTAPITMYSAAGIDDFASYELWIDGREYSGGDFRYAVVGVAHRPGIDSSNWRSSLTIANFSGAGGLVRLRYFPQEGAVVEREQPIRDRETLTWDDVAATLFGVDADSAGFVRVDSPVPLTITARTANESSTGSYGQLLPTLTPAVTAAASAGGLLTPLPGSESFRINIGLVNLSDHACEVPLTFNVRADTIAIGGEVHIPADSWIQLNDVLPPGTPGGSTEIGDSSGCSIWAYASVIDRRTNDPTTVPLDPEQTIHLANTPRGAARAYGWSD